MNPYRQKLERLIAERDLTRKQLRKLGAQIGEAQETLAASKEAFDIASTVMIGTQNEVKAFIEKSVTLALQTVFGPSYAFQLTYESKRGQSEATLAVLKDGEPYSPEDESGGGIIDVTSFGLRLTLWALSGEDAAPVFLLDEPARNLSRDKLDAFAMMLRQLVEMFHVQVIQVSHDETLIEGSDRAFMVTQRGGISSVSVVE